MMHLNSYRKTKEDTLELSGFLGLDYSSSPLDVLPSRATEMENLISADGINVKRNGWKQTQKFEGKINGMWQFKVSGSDKVRHEITVIHAGTKLHWKSKQGESSASYKVVTIDGGYVLRDEPSFAVLNNGRFFVLCGDYVMLEEDEDTHEWVWQKVANAKTTYVPTTTANIGYEGAAADKVHILDRPNLLTTRRKNSFEGKADSDSAVYYVDSRKIDDGELIFTALIAKQDGTLSEQTDKFTGSSGTLTNIGSALGKTISAVVDKPSGKVAISPPIPPLANTREDPFTIEFTYYPRNDKGEVIEVSSRVTNCKFGITFGLGGVSDRLFVAGNEDYPNICFNSAADDFTYFEDDATAACGTSSIPITAFSRLTDGTLAIHKKTSGTEANIYYRTGSTVSYADSETGETVIEEVFPIKAGSIGEGAVNPWSVANLSGDNLIVSENGVYGIVLSNNVTVSERYARERSRLINGRLTLKYDLRSAIATVYKNKYYLSVTNKESGEREIFIADARFTFTQKGDMPDTFNYEWWRWTNCSGTCFAEIDGAFCFGRSDGSICKFTDGYIDTASERLEEGDQTLDFSEGIMYINKNLNDKVMESDRVILYNMGGEDIYADFLRDFKVIEDRIQANELLRFPINDTEVSCVLTDGFLYNAKISDVDYSNFSFKLKYKDGQFVDGQTLKKITKISIAVRFWDYLEVFDQKTDSNTGLCSFKLKLDGVKIDFSVEFPLPSSQDIVATLIYNHNVNCSFESAILCPKGNGYSKTMHGISIVPEAGTNSTLDFGYKTIRSTQEIRAKGTRVFSFEDVDFTDFSFETSSFAHSYTKRLLKKYFNYVQLRFCSRDDKSCGVSSMSLYYTTLAKAKGVQ